MKLTVNVKPRKITAATKQKLINKISGSHYFSSNKYGYGILNTYGNDIKSIRVYNLHKVRAKYQQVKNKTSIDDTRKVSKKIRDAEWIAYVYDFDASILDALKLQVIQKTRNFEIKNQ